MKKETRCQEGKVTELRQRSVVIHFFKCDFKNRRTCTIAPAIQITPKAIPMYRTLGGSSGGGKGVGEGDAVGAGLGEGVTSGVGVGFAVGAGLGVGVAVGVGVGVGVGVLRVMVSE